MKFGQFIGTSWPKNKLVDSLNLGPFYPKHSELHWWFRIGNENYEWHLQSCQWPHNVSWFSMWCCVCCLWPWGAFFKGPIFFNLSNPAPNTTLERYWSWHGDHSRVGGRYLLWRAQKRRRQGGENDQNRIRKKWMNKIHGKVDEQNPWGKWDETTSIGKMGWNKSMGKNGMKQNPWGKMGKIGMKQNP